VATVAGELGWALEVGERVQPSGGTGPVSAPRGVPPGTLVRERDHPLAGSSLLRRSPCAGGVNGVLPLLNSETRVDFTPAWV